MRFSRKIPPGPSDPPPPRRLIDVATNDEGRLRDDRSGISSPIRPIPSHGVRPGPQLYPLASGRGGCVPGGVSHPAGEAPCPREGAPLAGPGGGQPLPGSAYLPLAQAAGERRHGPGAADLRDAGGGDSRALLHLRYYEGFTVAELARQFRTTAPALSARLYRAKQQLRKKLEELGYEEALSEDF